MNINLEDLKKLLEKAFDSALYGYRATKDDCINKIIEDFFSENEIDISGCANNFSNYYSYYACSSGLQTQPPNDFI